MNDAVGDDPRFRGVGVGGHAKGEAVEIRAVEKFMLFWGDGRTLIADYRLRQTVFSKCKREAK
jgi:hypothetical protein